MAKTRPTWTDVKAKLAESDRPGLVSLIQDLYRANEENRLFLHARFGLGEDSLEPYKKALDRWLWPDVLRNQNASAAKAKQVIASYRKAAGEPAGLGELMTFYCEQAIGFCLDVGYEDQSYLDALVNMFGGAIEGVSQLPSGDRKVLLDRLARVRKLSHDIGYGVGDDMDYLMATLESCD